MGTPHKETCAVLDNKKVAPGHWVLKLRSRSIAKAARPGQFVQVLCADDSFDPLLPRPFSFLSARNDAFTILHQVVGKGTELLSKKKKGDTVRILGPLGNGFTPSSRGHVALAGGGVGIPPLYHLAESLVKANASMKKKIHVFLGARDKTLLLCEKDFQKLGVNVKVATDDGSKGQKGYVTALLEEFLKNNRASSSQIHTCGPTPMLKAVSALAGKFNVPCEVSVEVPMACGFGACLGCAIKVCSDTKTDGPRVVGAPKNENFRFAIACTEGPVFKAEDILWD